MRQRVYAEVRAPVCRDFGNQNLCMYRNFTFVAAPSDATGTTPQVVSYGMSYSNPNSRGTCRTIRPQPVFYAPDRVVTGPTCDPPAEDNKPCYQYCTDQDLSSLEAGDIRSVFVDSAGPFNFAALFTSYVLEVMLLALTSAIHTSYPQYAASPIRSPVPSRRLVLAASIASLAGVDASLVPDRIAVMMQIRLVTSSSAPRSRPFADEYDVQRQPRRCAMPTCGRSL